MRCVLLYNPVSGRNRSSCLEQLGRVVEVLSDIGHSVRLQSTRAAGSAGEQAKEALDCGAEIVFACGGDGTVHEVMQGLVSEAAEPLASLGILPLGSANALARHLGLSLDPVEAAIQQIHGTPVVVPVGKLEYGEQTRYFAVMAGAGPDGALVYGLGSGFKSKLGRLAYYLHSARLFATRRFRPFEVRYIDAATGQASILMAVCVMAVQVSSLGGLFGKLTNRNGTIDDACLKLLVVKPPAAVSLPLWFISGWIHALNLNPLLRCVDVSEFSCKGALAGPVHIEADGEWIGRLPMRVSMAQKALRLLMPDVRSGGKIN